MLLTIHWQLTPGVTAVTGLPTKMRPAEQDAGRINCKSLVRPAQEMTLADAHIVAEDSPAKHVATMPQSVTMTPSHSAPPTRTNAMLLGTCGSDLRVWSHSLACAQSRCLPFTSVQDNRWAFMAVTGAMCAPVRGRM